MKLQDLPVVFSIAIFTCLVVLSSRAVAEDTFQGWEVDVDPGQQKPKVIQLSGLDGVKEVTGVKLGAVLATLAGVSDDNSELILTPSVLAASGKSSFTVTVQYTDTSDQTRENTLTIRLKPEIKPDEVGNLCSQERTFGNSSTFCYNLLVGAEGTSVRNLNNKTNVRSEFIAYQTFMTRSHGQVHLWGNMLFTSTGEQSATTASQPAAGSSAPAGQQDTAIEANINAGWFSNRDFDDAGLKLGVIAYSGVRKGVSDSIFAKRYYFGPRLARNPNQFIDIMVGKTEGVVGNRMEVRAQIPMGNVFLGMVLNHDIRNGPKEGADFIKLYFLAPVDFTKIFGSIK